MDGNKFVIQLMLPKVVRVCKSGIAKERVWHLEWLYIKVADSVASCYFWGSIDDQLVSLHCRASSAQFLAYVRMTSLSKS